MKISIELSGGLELLFNKQKNHSVEFPERTTIPLKLVLQHMRDKMCKERPELFLQANNNLRPGVLLMVNETDWELLGKLEYQVEDGDALVFISTLHGG